MPLDLSPLTDEELLRLLSDDVDTEIQSIYRTIVRNQMFGTNTEGLQSVYNADVQLTFSNLTDQMNEISGISYAVRSNPPSSNDTKDLDNMEIVETNLP